MKYTEEVKEILALLEEVETAFNEVCDVAYNREASYKAEVLYEVQQEIYERLEEA